MQLLRREALASKAAEGQLLFSVLSEGELHGEEAARDEACSGTEPRAVAAAPAPAPAVRGAGMGRKNTVRAWAWRCGEG